MRIPFTLLLTLLALTPARASDAEPLTLRSATVEQLAALDHVDAETARAVVALREQRDGELRTVEELRVLPGIEASTLDSLRRGTVVEVQMQARASRGYDSVDDVMQEFAHEPTVQQVQGWASEYAQIEPALVDRWLGASRSFAMLPQVRLQYRFRDGWDQDFQYFARDGFIDSPDDEVFDVLDDAGRDQDQWYTVQATWDLDKLVMSSERIRVLNEAQDIVKLRDRVLTEVTRLYFERRRLQVDLLLEPRSDLHSRATDQLRLMELTANLDALTGGTFSKALLRDR